LSDYLQDVSSRIPLGPEGNLFGVFGAFLGWIETAMRQGLNRDGPHLLLKLFQPGKHNWRGYNGHGPEAFRRLRASTLRVGLDFDTRRCFWGRRSPRTKIKGRISTQRKAMANPQAVRWFARYVEGGFPPRFIWDASMSCEDDPEGLSPTL